MPIFLSKISSQEANHNLTFIMTFKSEIYFDKTFAFLCSLGIFLWASLAYQYNT